MFNDNFLRACKGQETDHVPIWLMRQAGRYQKEYQKLKEKYSIIDISTTPELSAKVTLLPINQFELDAAIIFSDILIPLKAMGISFEYKKGYGPLIHNPITSIKDVEKLQLVDASVSYSYTGEALKILKKELNVPCIGFIGAPFTLASYMIEGGPSKNYAKLKAIMYNHQDLWDLLMEKLVKQMADYLSFQVKSGAAVVQIFDSWVGLLSRKDFRTFVYPYTRQLISLFKAKHPETPVILFGVNTAHLLKDFAECKPNVMGVDWKTDISLVWEEFNSQLSIQGNLDPTLLFAKDFKMIAKEASLILEKMASKKGFIFNLGHGILPETPTENVKQLCSFVRSYSKK